jgi:hypothetical protein
MLDRDPAYILNTPMLANDALDFQDSEVSSVELQDQQFIIRFSAGRVRTKSRSGIHEDAVLLRTLELVIEHPSVIQKDSGCIGGLLHGELNVTGVKVALIPVPYEMKADVELELTFVNGSVCKVSGQGATLKSIGEAPAVEWLKC